MEHILSPGKSRGLEVNDEDVKAFVEKHKEEPSTEESRVAAGISLGEAEGREEMSTALVKIMCGKWIEVQNFVEKYHPDKALARGNVGLFDEQAMSHFNNILKHREKQISLGRFLVKLPKCVSNSVQ